jgi:hypothetical protein
MDQLRITAAYAVKESDLTKAAKLQIMNFLENEATDAQVMALLLDGEIQVLDEMAETIVYDRFDAYLLDEKFGAAIKKFGSDFLKGAKEAHRSGITAAKAGKAVRAAGGSKRAAKATTKASAIRRQLRTQARVMGLTKGEIRAAGRKGMEFTRKLPGGAKKVRR